MAIQCTRIKNKNIITEKKTADEKNGFSFYGKDVL